MSCNYPMIRAETYESYTNKKGGKSYKAEFLSRDLIMEKGYTIKDLRRMFVPNKYRKIDITNCGQCIECRLQKSRDTATRCILEKYYGRLKEVILNNEGEIIERIYGAYEENECWFLTLTYADEYLPSHRTVNTVTGEVREGISVDPTDMQKFWKRVRKKWPDAKIKYINCSEYGSQTHRPHNHAIVFGLPLDMNLFKKVGMSENMEPYWTSPELEQVWPLGHVTIGRVTWESCAYVARYTLKKATANMNSDYYALQGILPEHVSMSDNIGLQYFIDNIDQIYHTDSVPVKNKKTGSLAKPPKRFDALYKEKCPDDYKMIKDAREMMANSSLLQKQLSTDMPEYERIIKDIKRVEESVKDLRKEL